MTDVFFNIFIKTWDLFLDSSVFIIFGLLVSGILKAFLSPDMVFRHLGKGRFMSVFKSSLLGIPIPLCSCGVLPAAISLKKQGANNGATAAFLISTPESGVDSISISWALLDPILTIFRPVAAFFMAFFAGITENILNWTGKPQAPAHEPFPMAVSSCCDGDHGHHHHHHESEEKQPIAKKLFSGLVYSFTDVWKDISGWFFIGLLIAGVITALIPQDFVGRYLGGGLSSMLFMLLIGIPIYICATASTPVAATFITMGVSPGAALVFLLAGPATNVTSLTVLTGTLGKKTTAIYLATIAVFSVLFGLLVDKLYAFLDIVPQAVVGSAAEVVPMWLKISGAVILLLISVKPLFQKLAVAVGSYLPGSKSGDKKTICTGSS